jgi:RimJ/RimL family protein N-acetyltransferase
VTVAVRELWRDRIWVARAWALVEETPERVVLANRPGSETRVPVDAAGERLRVPCDDWRLAAGRWESWTLLVARRGEPWSTLLYFDEHGAFLSWYVNFEQPLRGTPFGFDTLDHKLDLVVTADGEQRLKDQDDLDAAARAGALDAEEVRDAARRVVAEPPWPTGWEDRPPDASLEPLALPPGWDATPLRTERLRLTPFAPCDLKDVAAVYGEGAPAELELSTTTWRESGFGFWVVRDRETDAFAAVVEAHLGGPGLDGIGPDEVEIGWIVEPSSRNAGVATEAARAVVADLFGRTRVTRAAALIKTPNEPSQRVAAKLGMRLRSLGRARNGDRAEIYELRHDLDTA